MLTKKMMRRKETRMAKECASGKDIESSQQWQSIFIGQSLRSVPERKNTYIWWHLQPSHAFTHSGHGSWPHSRHLTSVLMYFGPSLPVLVISLVENSNHVWLLTLTAVPPQRRWRQVLGRHFSQFRLVLTLSGAEFTALSSTRWRTKLVWRGSRCCARLIILFISSIDIALAKTNNAVLSCRHQHGTIEAVTTKPLCGHGSRENGRDNRWPREPGPLTQRFYNGWGTQRTDWWEIMTGKIVQRSTDLEDWRVYV